MSVIPLLLNHDTSKPIGMWEPGGVARFNDDQRITREQLFEIFGGAGIRVLDCLHEDGVIYVRAFEVLEFSLVPDAVPVRRWDTGEPTADVARKALLTLGKALAKTGDEIFLDVAALRPPWWRVFDLYRWWRKRRQTIDLVIHADR